MVSSPSGSLWGISVSQPFGDAADKPTQRIMVSSHQSGSWVGHKVEPPAAGPLRESELVAVADDGSLWLVAQLVDGGGMQLFRWRPGSKRPEAVTTPEVPRALAIHPDGSLWLGGACGLWRRAGDGWQATVAGTPLQMTADAQGVWWLTDAGDIYRYDGTRVQAYAMDHDPTGKTSPANRLVVGGGTAWGVGSNDVWLLSKAPVKRVRLPVPAPGKRNTLKTVSP